MRYRSIETCTGPFAIIVDGDGVLRTAWLDPGHGALPSGARRDGGLHAELVDRLTAYFSGERVTFADVPLPPGPPFMRRCWDACRRIPRGETRGYADLAGLAGSGGAARAAGQAMRHNPLPVIVPCHRVITGRGRLGGFAGSTDAAGPELARKRRLLALEGALPPMLIDGVL